VLGCGVVSAHSGVVWGGGGECRRVHPHPGARRDPPALASPLN